MRDPPDIWGDIDFMGLGSAWGIDEWQGGIAGGGWPDFWENFDDIIRAPWDLVTKIGEVGKEIIQVVWTSVGGAIRWLGDKLWDAGRWIVDQVLALWEFIAGRFMVLGAFIIEKLGGAVETIARWVSDAAQWVWERVEDGLGVMRQVIEVSLAVVRNAVIALYTWVETKVTDAAAWTWQQIQNAMGLLQDALLFSLTVVNQGVQNLYQWVADKVTDAATWTRDNVVEPIMGGIEFIGDKFRDAFMWIFEHAIEPFANVFERKLAIPGKLLRGQYASVFDFLDDMMDPPPQVVRNVLALFLVIVALVPTLVLSMSPLSRPIMERWTQEIASIQGQTLLNREDLSQARWRKLDVDIDQMLSRHGYGPVAKEVIAKLDERIPGPQDLVRMAIREAFNPPLAEALGFTAEFGEQTDFIDWLKKQGYDQEWARKYWIAHWDLPSISQGIELFQRRIITEQQLFELMKALDIPQAWRTRIRDVAYNPLTRVDTRRMYQQGVLGEEEVYWSYRDLGYNDVNARRLTEFTKKLYPGDEDVAIKEMQDQAANTFREGYRRHVLSREEALDYLVQAHYSPDVAEYLLTLDDVKLGLRPDLDADVDVRELTQTVILRAYNWGVWTRQRAQTELETMGYLPASADLLIQLEDVKKEQERTETMVKLVRERYLVFELDDRTADAELQQLQLPAERRDLLLRQWRGDRTPNMKRLTATQVISAAKTERFSDSEAVAYLLELGYSADDASTLMTISQRPLSEQQLLQAWQRGLFGDDDVITGLRRLGYSDEDAATTLGIAPRRLEASQVVALFKRGSIQETEALERIQQLGYSIDDAVVILSPELRALTVGQISAAYMQQLVTEADALEQLQKLGYSEEDARLVLGTIPVGLNVALIVEALKREEITRSDALRRLQLLGYSPADAELVLRVKEGLPAGSEAT
jgi:hypothetical protein